MKSSRNLKAHLLLHALVEEISKEDMSQEAALFAIADEHGFDYSGTGGQEELESFDLFLFGSLVENGDIVPHEELLMAFYTEGEMEVLKSTLCYKMTPISEKIILVINGQRVSRADSGKKGEQILLAMELTFSDYILPKNIAYGDRIKKVGKAFHGLVSRPRDTYREVHELLVAVCNDEFATPMRTPEHIGRCYALYLRECIEEQRDANYIMAFSGYIRSNRWKKHDPAEIPDVKLTDGESHQKAKEIFDEEQQDKDKGLGEEGLAGNLEPTT